MVLGVLKWSEEEFWDSDLHTIDLAVKCHYEQIDYRERREWERVRWLGAVVLQPHAKKGKQVTPQSLMRFDWEKGGKVTEDDTQRSKRKMKKWQRRT